MLFDAAGIKRIYQAKYDWDNCRLKNYDNIWQRYGYNRDEKMYFLINNRKYNSCRWINIELVEDKDKALWEKEKITEANKNDSSFNPKNLILFEDIFWVIKSG